MSKLLNDVKKLLNSDDDLELDRVKKLRKRAAADPSSSELSKQLIRVEKAVEQGNVNPLEEVEILRDQLERKTSFQLEMVPSEPFPELRLDVLSRAVEKVNGTMKEIDHRLIEVTVDGDARANYLRSMYHWSSV